MFLKSIDSQLKWLKSQITWFKISTLEEFFKILSNINNDFDDIKRLADIKPFSDVKLTKDHIISYLKKI